MILMENIYPLLEIRDWLVQPDMLVLMLYKVWVTIFRMRIGNEQSRRDDIEALAYVLIYLVVGELPW